MIKAREEWFSQAEYDIGTAEAMFNSNRYIYAVFMSHLSIEKALKGLYTDRLNELPPKTHNLIFLAEKIHLSLPDDIQQWIFFLNRLSIPTRYPDDLQKMQLEYTKEKTKELLKNAQEILQWLKTQ